MAVEAPHPSGLNEPKWPPAALSVPPTPTAAAVGPPVSHSCRHGSPHSRAGCGTVRWSSGGSLSAAAAPALFGPHNSPAARPRPSGAPANDRRVARDWPVEIYAAPPPPRSRRSRSRLGGNGAQGDDSGGRQRRRACAVFGLARTGRLTTAYVDAAGLFGRGGRGGHPRFSPRRANVVPCTSTPAGGVGWSPGYAREGGTNATAPRNGGGGTSGPVA